MEQTETKGSGKKFFHVMLQHLKEIFKRPSYCSIQETMRAIRFLFFCFLFLFSLSSVSLLRLAIPKIIEMDRVKITEKIKEMNFFVFGEVEGEVGGEEFWGGCGAYFFGEIQALTRFHHFHPISSHFILV